MKHLVLIALFAVACIPITPAPQADSSAGAVHFTVERVSAKTIRLSLDNGSTQPIGYNLCSSELQLRSGSEWVPVVTEDVCTLQIMSLNPGADATLEKQLPDRLAAGEYRYVAAIENPFGSPAVKVASEPFAL